MGHNDRVNDLLAELGMSKTKKKTDALAEAAGDLINGALSAFGGEEQAEREQASEGRAQTSLGEIALITKLVDEKTCEVDLHGTKRLVHFDNLEKKPEIGDRVVMDIPKNAIKRNLGPDEDRFAFTGDTNVTWDDIGGLAEAKKDMLEAIELPLQHPEIFQHYGKKPIKGILLYGPPGCGKTMFGKATATAIAKIQKAKGAASGFIYVKGPEVLDPHIGVTETTIRQLFTVARKHKEKYGYPAVLFIDEAEALLPKRGSVKSSDIDRTIVPSFLAEMDGLQESCAIVLLATNRPDSLDTAVVRDGRVDRKIKIGRPDKEASRDVFRIYMKKIPPTNGVSVQELIELATEEMFDPRRILYQITLGNKHQNKILGFTLGHLASGALIAGIVDKATSAALNRDIANKTKTGVTKEDIRNAVDATLRQQMDVDHTDDLEDFVHDFREDVENIKKIRKNNPQ